MRSSRGVVAGVLAILIVGALARVDGDRFHSATEGDEVKASDANANATLPRLDPLRTEASVVAAERTDESDSRVDPAHGDSDRPAEPPVLDFAAHAARLGVGRAPWPPVRVRVARADDDSPVADAMVTVQLFRCCGPFTEEERRERDILGREPAIAARTNDRGEITISTAHPVLVVTHVPGFGPEAATIEADRQPETIALALRPAGTFRARVVDAGGRPVAKAHVGAVGIRRTGEFAFWGFSCGNPLMDWRMDLGETDGDGWLDEVACYATGRVAFSVTKDGRSDLFPSVDFEGATGSRTLELRLPPCCRLAIAVRHVDGSPASDEHIVVTRRFDEWGYVEEEAWLDDEARCELTLGGAGSYSVELMEFAEDGRVSLARRDVDLVLGENFVDLVDPRPAPVVAISPEEAQGDDDEPDEAPEALTNGEIAGHGIVGTADVTDCTVVLVRDDEALKTTDLDESGNFRFEDVEPGTYRISALLAGFERFDGPPFEVEPGERTTLPDWSLATCGRFDGQVVDSSGREVAGVEVELQVRCASSVAAFMWSFMTVDSATTDESGLFTLHSVGTPARLCIELPGRVPVTVPIAADVDRDASPITVTVGATRSVRGRVVAPGGLPSATLKLACRVTLSPGEKTRLGDDYDSVLTLDEAVLAEDGSLPPLRIPETECDLELWLNTSAWTTIGATIARRHVPAGTTDVDLGEWWLPSAGR